MNAMDCDSDEQLECGGEGRKRAFPLGDAVGERESKRVASEVSMDDAPWPLADWGEVDFRNVEGQMSEVGELPGADIATSDTGWSAYQHLDAFCQSFEPWDRTEQDDLLEAAFKVESGSTSVAGFSGVYSRVLSRSPFGGETGASEAARGETSSWNGDYFVDGGVDNDGTSPMAVDGTPENDDTAQRGYDTCFGVVSDNAEPRTRRFKTNII